jgi:hypoxanthine phosphoribosyltransferase
LKSTPQQIKFLPFEILLDQKRLSERIRQLGRQITADYAGKELFLLGVLKGCVMFMADLMRHIELPLEIDFTSPAACRIGDRVTADITLSDEMVARMAGKHVLVIEGVVDTGRTAEAILERLAGAEPASVEIVTLLDKPGSHRTTLDIRYKGFSIGNDFVIGFGLDNAQKYRNLPYIGRVLDT